MQWTWQSAVREAEDVLGVYSEDFATISEVECERGAERWLSAKDGVWQHMLHAGKLVRQWHAVYPELLRASMGADCRGRCNQQCWSKILVDSRQEQITQLKRLQRCAGSNMEERSIASMEHGDEMAVMRVTRMASMEESARRKGERAGSKTGPMDAEGSTQMWIRPRENHIG